MGKGRAPCCDKSKVKKGAWSPEEDLKLISFVKKHGHPNWRSLPKRAGLLRCGKSCRLRWINYLRPDLKRGNFTKEEEETIIKLYQSLGSKWSKIASCLPGRTDNEIKNVWNTHLKKRQINQKDPDHIAAKLESSSTNSSSFSPSSCSSSATSSIPPVEEERIQGSEPKPAFCSSSSSISSSSSSSSAPNYSNSISPTDDHVPIPKDEMGINNSLDNLGGGTTTTTTTTTTTSCEGFNSSDQPVIEIPTDDQYSEIDLWDMLGVPMQTNEYSNLEGLKFGEEYDVSWDLEWREWLRSMENRLGIEELAATSDDRDHDIVINPTTKDGPAGQGNSHFQMWPFPPQNFGF